MWKTNISCLYLKSPSQSSKLIIYFHANAEDLGSSYELLDKIRKKMNINIIAPEYPGYGIYTHAKVPGEEKPGEY